MPARDIRMWAVCSDISSASANSFKVSPVTVMFDFRKNFKKSEENPQKPIDKYVEIFHT
jgi:hypothetical protein